MREENGERGRKRMEESGSKKARAGTNAKGAEGTSRPFHSKSGKPGCCQITIGWSLDKVLTLGNWLVCSSFNRTFLSFLELYLGLQPQGLFPTKFGMFNGVIILIHLTFIWTVMFGALKS